MRPLLPLFRNDWEARRHGKRGSLLWSLWWHYTDRFPSSWMWPWRPLCWLIGHEDDGGACITCGKWLAGHRQDDGRETT